MLKGSWEGATKNTTISFCAFLLVLFYAENRFKGEISKDLYTCLMCDKLKLTLQNPLGPPDVWVLQSTNGPASHHSPSLPHCRDRTLSFLAWISFPKASYYYFFIIIWCALHSSGKSQSNVRSESTRAGCAPAVLVPCQGMKVPPPSSVSFLLSKTISLFYCINYFRRPKFDHVDIFCWQQQRIPHPQASCGPSEGFCISPLFESYTHRFKPTYLHSQFYLYFVTVTRSYMC